VRQPREQIDIETNRIVDRLNGLPMNRVNEALQDSVRAAAQQVVDIHADPTRPGSASVPVVGASALGAQIAVVVHDYLETPTAASDDAAVAEVLTELRRSLP
jgi:hypothetical protein